ncbi:LysE family translocator [Peribacillus simplex]|uniref:LysE family translocator n=1 Tax=Peribacillus simplex TaxID=1478 RepID=UPI0036707947
MKNQKRIEKPITKKVNNNLSFRQALLIELLNPKTSLFFLDFLPQFVKSDGSPVTIQLLMLGLTFVLMSIMYTTLLVFLTSTIGNKLLVKSNSSSNWFGNKVSSSNTRIDKYIFIR